VKIEASDCQIDLPVKVVNDRELGGWVWMKIDGAETDLATHYKKCVDY
jgi:hypothetical protein